MSCSRRDFLKQACGGTLASILPVSAFTFLTNEEARAAVANANVRWGFLVDTRKCVGCGLCVNACKKENEIPYDAPVTRTWVERYVMTKGGALVRLPEGASGTRELVVQLAEGA